MKKLLVIMTLGLSLLAAALPSMATTADQLNSAGLTNLTPEQKARVVQQIATMNAENASPQHQEKELVDTFDKYSDLAIKIGKALAGGARELGIAANEFLQTPAGKWTLAIIVYKTMGADLILLAAAIVVLIVGTLFVLWLTKHLRTVEVEYNKEKTNIFGNHPVTSVVKHKMKDGDIGFVSFIGAVCLIVVVVLMCNIG